MKQVVARRDDNWKKLQHVNVFDEREQLEMRGPNGVALTGASAANGPGTSARVFSCAVRPNSTASPSGTRSGGPSRAVYLKQAQERDKRAARGTSAASDGSGTATDNAAATDALVCPEDELAQDLGGVIRQNRPPQFISSAYFLRFKFEEGKYALAGRETIDGHEVLRIEDYPARMFGGTDWRRTGKSPSDDDKARDAAFQRMMNKVALVTLWVEPNAHQIVKYTFDNVGFDFLPAQWLVHVSDLKATMSVGQPFPDVWLPTSMELNLAMTLALGQLDVRYGLV